MTDAEFNGLGGKVKSVVEEVVTAIPAGWTNGGVAKTIGPRRIRTKELYSNKGNILERTEFGSSSNPRFIYSTIDGFKTFRIEWLEADGSVTDPTKMVSIPGIPSNIPHFVPPAVTNTDRSTLATGIVRPSSEVRQTKASPQSEYGVKFVYKYDANGRIVEEKRFRNDGSLLDSTVYQYDAMNFISGSRKYQNGELWEIRNYAFDANNNLVLSSLVYPTNRIKPLDYVNRYFDYLIDDHGNWIQRTEVKVKTNGAESITSVEICYRTIVYY